LGEVWRKSGHKFDLNVINCLGSPVRLFGKVKSRRLLGDSEK
jgi:hypothetical protein